MVTLTLTLTAIQREKRLSEREGSSAYRCVCGTGSWLTAFHGDETKYDLDEACCIYFVIIKQENTGGQDSLHGEKPRTVQLW
jgi:hypothetical protein